MAKRVAAKDRKKSHTGVLLVVLAAIVGFGAWNYRRNVALEQSAKTTYSNLSVADLDRLIAAYKQEIDGLHAHGQPRRAKVRETADVADGVREFERVQRASRSVREAGYAVAEREGVLHALEAERAKRTPDTSPWLVFLRRAFTI
jgi:hypothetical protein